ncbi:MAG: tRNA (guanine(10)-N(2))-dimethyltransferase [Candidatus Micrarchaeaceae archaeon]
METVKEGLASIYTNGAFYNSKMRRLRDFSVLALKVFVSDSARILDSTAATGIRGIRYLLEAAPHGESVLLEINPKAYETLKSNIALNGLSKQATAFNTSVQSFANNNTAKIRFDVIDLDPFGTPAPYIYDLMKLANNKALFMITATDTATLCGAEGDACLRIYAAKPIKNEFCHEASIRILLAYVAKIAAQFNFGIEPLLSIAELHYIRLFIKLNKGAKNAVISVKSIGTAASCSACHAFYYSFGIGMQEQKCKHCGNKLSYFGPLWLSSLYDKSVVGEMFDLAEEPGERSTLQSMLNEYDTPFFYSLDKITENMHIGSVKREEVIAALRNKGLYASATLFGSSAIKTNASIDDVEQAVGEAHTKATLNK